MLSDVILDTLALIGLLAWALFAYAQRERRRR